MFPSVPGTCSHLFLRWRFTIPNHITARIPRRTENKRKLSKLQLRDRNSSRRNVMFRWFKRSLPEKCLPEKVPASKVPVWKDTCLAARSVETVHYTKDIEWKIFPPTLHPMFSKVACVTLPENRCLLSTNTSIQLNIQKYSIKNIHFLTWNFRVR